VACTCKLYLLFENQALLTTGTAFSILLEFQHHFIEPTHNRLGGRDLQQPSGPTLVQWTGTPTAPSGAQSPIQSDLGCIQGQGTHLHSGQPVPVPYRPYCKIFLLTRNLNLPSFNLKPFLLVLSEKTLLKSLSPSFLQPPFRYWKAALRSPQSLLFSMLHSPRSQPVLVGEFHPWDHFCGHPLYALQQLHVSPVLSTPHLDAVLQLRSHSTEQRSRSPPSPYWPHHYGCSPGYSWLSELQGRSPAAIHQYPQVAFSRAVLCPYIPQLVSAV